MAKHHQQHQQRYLELSRSCKNVSLSDGGDMDAVSTVSTDNTDDRGDAAAATTEVLPNELRVPPLFTSTHTLGSLQPRYCEKNHLFTNQLLHFL